jgi:hypothetical protein
MPARTDGVNYSGCGDLIALRGFGVSCVAATQQAALSKKFRAGGSVNRAVYAATAEKGTIGCVDDGVYA